MDARLKRILICVVLLAVAAVAWGAEGGTAFQGEELLPPAPKAGECYARVFVPPAYRTVTETVLKTEASERLEIVPAAYDWVEEQVMVQGPAEKLELVPAEYQWVQEQVLVKAASSRLEQVPAVYDMVTERVLDTPAHTVWKKGRGPIEKIDYGTGEILCLVEVPASYKTVTKRVVVEPPSTRRVEIPAEYKTVKRRVMSAPPSTRVVEIPAKYEVVRVRREVSPPRVQTMEIPAQYQKLTRREKISEGRMEWQRILCETNVTRGTVHQIQQALMEAGHDPGRVDGVIGARTMEAVRAYQQAKGLPVGQLTYETLDSLGVRLTAAKPPAS